MPGLRPLPSRRVVRALKAFGFVELRQHGSHLVLSHADGRRTVVPMHSREEIGRGLLRRIIQDAGIDPDEFMEMA